MAGGNPASSSSSSSSSSVAVFIDTSLDTRLAILVSPSDTVADLKANVRIQHALCFPDIGDVTGLSVKARRRGSFYHLCDSMLVWSAFNGIKGSWLLHMDVFSTCHQAETTRIEMTYPLLEMPNASCPSKDASTMPGTGHVVSLNEKDVRVKDYANVDKANDEMVSTKKKKLRKRTSAASNDQLVDEDSFLAEKEKYQGNEDPLKGPSTDSVCPESITSLHDDPSQKDCTMDEKKKKKRRTKESTTNHQNDIHSDVPESGNDDPLKEPSTDPVAKSGSFIHNKEVFISENVRPESITSLHDDPSQKDCTMDEKKKKESSTHQQNDIHSDVQESGNDDPSKEPSSDPVANSGSCVHNKEVFISENVCPESITSLHHDPLQKDCTMDEKKKRRKKESSTNHQNEIHSDVPESRPIDTNDVLSIKNQDGKKKPQEASMKDRNNLGEERDAPFLSGKDTRNVTGGDFLEFGSVHPLSLNREGSNFNGTISEVGLSIHETGNEYTQQGQLTDADLQGILVDKNAYPRNADVVVTTLQEAALDEMVSTKKTKTRKRSNASSNDQLVDKGNSLSVKEKHNAYYDPSELPSTDLVAKSGSCIQKKEVVVLEVLPESITPLHNDPSPMEHTMDEKKKKKKKKKRRKKEASTYHQNDIHSVIPDSRLIGSHVLSIENHEAMVNLQGASMKDHKNLCEERDALLLSDKDTRNVTGAGYLEFVSLDPLSLKHEGSNLNGTISEVVLSIHESGSGDTKQGHLTDADPKVTLVDDNADLRNSYAAVTTVQEAAVETHAEEGTQALENSHRRKKKHTSGSSINKHDSLHSFGVNVNEDNLAASGNNYDDLWKESDVMNTSSHINHTEGNLEVPSFSDAEGLQCRSRKRSRKIKLFNPQPPTTYEAILSSGHQVTESSLKETPADQFKDRHEGSKDSIVGEAALLGIQVADDSRVPLNSTDKTSRRRRKKSTKAELPNHDCIDKKHTHSFMKATTKESPRDTLEDNCKEKVERSKSQRLGDTFKDNCKEKVEMSKSLIVIGEAAVGEISAMAEHPTSDLDRINFLEYFVPKEARLEVHALTQDHSSMETESRNSNGETGKRKRTSTNSEDFTHNLANPYSLNELKKKPQNDDPSKLDLVNILVPLLNKESKTKRGYNQKSRGRASDLGAVHESVDKKVDQKPQISTSDTHHKAPLSKDEQNKNLKEFEVCYRKSTSKPVSGHSSASEDSNVDLEETQEGTCLKAHAYMNSSGAPSAAYGENNEATNANILIQKKVKSSSRTLSSILRNTSSYRRAWLTAYESQAEAEDSESQYIEDSQSLSWRG